MKLTLCIIRAEVLLTAQCTRNSTGGPLFARFWNSDRISRVQYRYGRHWIFSWLIQLFCAPIEINDASNSEVSVISSDIYKKLMLALVLKRFPSHRINNIWMSVGFGCVFLHCVSNRIAIYMIWYMLHVALIQIYVYSVLCKKWYDINEGMPADTSAWDAFHLSSNILFNYFKINYFMSKSKIDNLDVTTRVARMPLNGRIQTFQCTLNTV